MEGIGYFSYETLRRMVPAHPDDEFIFFFDRPYDKQFIFSDNVTPVVVSPPARHPFLWHYWFQHRLPSAMRKHNPDVLLSCDGYLPLNSQVPSVAVLHDLAFEEYPHHMPFLTRRYYKRYMPRFARKATRVATVSEFSKQDIVKRYSIPEDKVDVVYNAGKEVFRPMASNDQTAVRDQYSGGNPYFIYVGTLQPRKNIDRLLQAFENFKHRRQGDTKLIITGRRGWQTESMMQVFHKMQYAEDVVFTDYLPLEELARLVAASVGLVYVSTYEGFGVPLVEAMHCEVPVITSNVTSMPEVAGDAALLVDPFSVNDITNAMLQVREDESVRQRLIEAGRSQRSRFSWENTAVQLYNSLQATQ
jgi:glycosyltransferase involved in cell wall biosynthesis